MVQVKKAEMRQTIIDVATDEFMKKGYENASLRVIAQKSHTTLGNIYHYFKNKEILLETIVLPVLDNIDALMDEHIQNYKANVLSKEELLYYTEHLEEYVEKFEFRCLFDKRVVIILELKSSHLLKRKEEIIDKIQKHLQEHYHLNDDAHYAKIVLDVLTDCLKHVLIEHENMDDAKREFIKLFRLFCTGVMGQMI